MPTFKVTRPGGRVEFIDAPGIEEATRDVGFGDSVEGPLSEADEAKEAKAAAKADKEAEAASEEGAS